MIQLSQHNASYHHSYLARHNETDAKQIAQHRTVEKGWSELEAGITMSNKHKHRQSDPFHKKPVS
jgi:hypothetical protein